MSWDSTALSVLVVFPDTRTENHGTSQGYPTTYRVYNCTTCKVMEYSAESVHHKAAVSSVHQPASAPCPVTFDRIDDKTYKECVNHVHREFCTFCHCP